MRKPLFLLIALCVSIVTFGQNDKMFKHSGEKIDVKIIKVGEFTISFTYPNETAEQTISKYAVAKIEYASGRKEEVTEKIVIGSKDDWEKVILLEDVAASTGLKRQGEIKGKTGAISYRLGGNADKKSMERLKKEAAELGAPFVLLTSDKDSHITTQSIKKGIAYSYN